MTFEQLVDGLKQAGALFQSGKGGIWVTRTPAGAVLQNLNRDAKPIRFNEVQTAWIVHRFPALAVVLSRNMETMRRVQGLRARLAGMMGKPLVPDPSATPLTFDPKTNAARTMTAQEKQFIENLPARQYRYLESLDTDAARRLPTSLKDLDELSVKSPEKLARSFTAVDVTDPQNPVRRIFQVEFDTGALRTDEAVLEYKVSDDEMKRLAAGDTFRTTIRNASMRDLRVFYADVNKPLGGETLLKHHLKTLETVESVLKKFLVDYKGTLVGVVRVLTKEVYLQSAHVEVHGGTASVGRATPVSDLPAIDKVTTTCIDLESRVVNGAVEFQPTVQTRAMAALRALSDAQQARFVQRLEALAAALAKAARQAA